MKRFVLLAMMAGLYWVKGYADVVADSLATVHTDSLAKDPVWAVWEKTLGEVTVKGTRPQYRMVNGGMSIDVKNSVLAQVGDALDVLHELPRVNVDGKGAVTVTAKGAVTVTAKGTPLIYINNRLVRDTKELNRMKSSDIKNVEVITNPGARYDASVSSVIRIVT